MVDVIDPLYRAARAACEQGRIEEGVGLLQRALKQEPNDRRLHKLLGLALTRIGRHADALASVDRAIALAPMAGDVFGLRADILVALGRLDEAVACYDRALILAPDSAEDWCNRGAVLYDLRQHDTAIASFDRAIALAPAFALAYYNRGNAHAALSQYKSAVDSYERTLALNPDHADALNNQGQSLRALGNSEQALLNFDRALVSMPGHLPALINRAGVLGDMRRPDEALAATDRILAASPDVAAAWQIRGYSLLALGRVPEAIASYERAVTLGLAGATAMLGYCSLLICDWPRAEHVANMLSELIESRALMSPFAILTFAPSSDLQRKNAEAFVKHELAGIATFPATPRSCSGDRIRLGYISADIGSHAVTSLIVGLLEQHDRARFDVMGISVGPQRCDDLRQRVARACGEVHELGMLTDNDAALRIRDLRIDIAIDLSGYTEGARPGIFARRPAPIQVSYLGYLGPLATSSIDYILADEVALPTNQQSQFAEKIVHLPDCFLVNDNAAAIASTAPSRRQVGLPQGAIVLCSFNNSYRFRAPVFDIWMRLLRDFDDCVLWLLAANDSAVDNLHCEARSRGVDPDRLVFAPRMALPDLFLDTLPYNAGATAAAALWSGVPVLTARGETLVGRMAASMLYAVGLPELAATNLVEYEMMARALIENPGMLTELRGRLARNKRTHPLFDTERSCGHIESAFETMWGIFSRGETPRSFVVAPINRSPLNPSSTSS